MNEATKDCIDTGLRVIACGISVQVLDRLTLEEGTGRFPDTSVANYQSTPRKIPEGRRYHFHRRRSQTSQAVGTGFEAETTD